MEEFFKALKTGCRYEDRQLESFTALWITLALLLPIATRLLQLRSMARDTTGRDTRDVLSEDRLAMLRAMGPGRLPASPSAQDVLLAIAALGGHIKNNGAPGWIVLWRGMRELEERFVGWCAARRFEDNGVN
jgi:hypothetical protein